MRYVVTVFFAVFLAGGAAAESVEPGPPLRGEALHQKAKEILHWLYTETIYGQAPVPKIEFVDNVDERYSVQAAQFGLIDDTSDKNLFVEGLYVHRERTVYLRTEWTGRTEEEIVLLVHELAHYLQLRARKKFPCMKSYEYDAIRLSIRYIGFWDFTKLDRLFELDSCIPPPSAMFQNS